MKNNGRQSPKLHLLLHLFPEGRTINSVNYSIFKESKSILKSYDTCAKETRGPALTSDSFQSAPTYVPKPNLRLGFLLKPCQQVQLELFISWRMGLNSPKRSDRECMLI